MLACEWSIFVCSLLILATKPYIPKTVTSLCAAFSTPSSKSPPVLITTYSTTHGTIADVRTPLSIQARPLSGDGIDLFINIFKGDPQKKWDKELSKKVRVLGERSWANLLTAHRSTPSGRDYIRLAIQPSEMNISTIS